MASLGPIKVTLRDNTPLSIRTLRADDASCVQAFLVEAASTTQNLLTCADEFAARSAQSEADRLREAELNPGALYLGAFDPGGEMVGSTTILAHDRRRCRHTARLGMVTATAWRGRGLGKQMLRTGIEWVREHPFIEKLCLEVIHSNEHACKLYESLGFEQEGLRSGQTRIGHPNDPSTAPNESVRTVDEILMGLWVCAPGDKLNGLDC